MNLTTHQLAEILVGIARSQQAVIDAIESSKAGFKGTYLAPALDSAARIRSTNRAPTLQEFPARVLLQCQGRGGPNIEQIVKDLEALMSGQAPALSTVAPAAARAAARNPTTPAAAASTPAADADDDLDMTKL